MLIGYARTVEDDKTRRKQNRVLKQAGCKEIVKEDSEGESVLADLLQDLRKGDTLVVWRLDCLVGSLKDLIGVVSTVLDSRASLHSLTEDFAVSSRNGRNMLHTLNALSDFQYSLIKHRTMQGLRQARAKGRVGGRPRKLGPAQVKKAEAMLDKARMTKTEVATHFGVCRQTLNQALAMSASQVS